MPTTSVRAAARSHPGRVRKSNEDAFVVANLAAGTVLDAPLRATAMDVVGRGVLLAVSDGMGGHAAGEVASAMVVESLTAMLGQADEDEPPEVSFEDVVQRTNSDVNRAARDRGKEGMGATLTAVLVVDQTAYIAQVGDSRAYVLRRSQLTQLTRDQSFLQMLLDTGALSPDQAQSFTKKNWILQAMGVTNDLKVGLSSLELRNGDRVLICSDGLHGLVGDEDLTKILAGGEESSVCDRLIELANERGGSDNITVVVATIAGDDVPEADDEESVDETLEVLAEYIPTAEGAKPIDSSPEAPDAGTLAGYRRLSVAVMGLVLLFTAAGYWFVLSK